MANPTQPPTTNDCLAAYPLSNLELDGLTKPNIDGKIDILGDGWGDSAGISGWDGSEYFDFTMLPMYESGDQSGKNTSSEDGIAFIGYDCNNTRFCVAVYLTYNSSANANCTVNEIDDENFVQVGIKTMLKKSTNGAQFAYVKYSHGDNSNDPTIGK
jgi:hypothetical protein